jgi:hypothetical protein
MAEHLRPSTEKWGIAAGAVARHGCDATRPESEARSAYRLGFGSVLSRTVREQPVLSQARMTTR